MQRRLLATTCKNHGLFHTPKRPFFLKSQGDYDFTTPLINLGMWTTATVGLVAYGIGRYGSKTIQQEPSNTNKNHQTQTSPSTKPK